MWYNCVMREIPLTQGKVALVSDCDFEYLNQWKWYAHKCGNTFYAERAFGSKGNLTHIKMHRVVAERMGLNIDLTIDHINRCGLDNQRVNLRPATQKQQGENCQLQSNNTSGCTGVCWDKRASKWQASIRHNGKRIYLGLFINIKDAIKARKAAERKYFTHAETV